MIIEMDNTEPSRGRNRENVRAAEGVTTRARAKAVIAPRVPDATSNGEEIVWTAQKCVEVGHKQAGGNKIDSGYEALDITPSDVFTSAEFNLKQAAVAVLMSGLEELQNSGDEAVIDLLESRIENAEITMRNRISEDIYSDGTADGGRQIGGLQLLVSDAGTGQVGGINASAWSFWQNYVFDFSSNSLTASASTIQRAMNTAWLNLTRNRDQPDLIVADNTYFQYYWESLQAIQRIQNTDLAKAGFTNLKFMNADVVPDGAKNGDAPANHMYFLNTDYLFFRPHSKRNFVPLKPDRYSTNQDAMIKLIAFAGNMTVNNRSLQGVIVA